MDTIKIGVLLPLSTIFPIAKDFEKGLKDGLKNLANESIEVELVKEFIGQGDVKSIEKACNKLFNFDDADLVTGVLSTKAAVEVAENFSRYKKPLLVNDLGASIPDVSRLNEYVFINSPHLWQHAYALGYWGVKKFGKKGMFVGSVYDAGYSLSHMFYEGMIAADATAQWSFSVPPMPPHGGLTDMSITIPYLEQYQPDFIFAAFCGAETSLFLNELIKYGWHKKTSITGLPYLVNPIGPLEDDATIYTTQIFSELPDIEAAKAFYHLGWQSGTAIAKAAALSADTTNLGQEIAKQNSFFNVAYPAPKSNRLSIISNDIARNETSSSATMIDTIGGYDLQIDKLSSLTAEISTGWFNPYLCI